MKGFVLTDRGKIFVAIVVVIPILILSIILAVLAFTSDKTPPDDDGQAYIPPTDITPQPPVNGGFDPPKDIIDDPDDDDKDPTGCGSDDDDTTNDDKDDDDKDNDNDTDVTPPDVVSNPILNLTTGALSFSFSPKLQTALDKDTSTMLDQFLLSKRNVPENDIAVETPKLSSNDTTLFMNVITSALKERNVNTSRIVHIVDPKIPLSDNFEVVVYYIERTGK